MILPSYSDDVSGVTSARIDALATERRVSQRGVAEFFGSSPDATATCFVDITRHWDPLRPAPSTRAGQAGCGDAIEVLRTAVSSAAEGAGRPVVALSGGLDSVVLALLLGDVLGQPPSAATLVTGLAGYCESERTARTADQLGVDLIEIAVDADDIIEAVPDAVRAAEVPLYNLHPVTKWVFAQRVAALGFDRVLTGDGADQVIAHDPGVDYLPVVGAMFAESAADVRWPFLDPATIDVFGAVRPDPNKAALRTFVASRLGTELAAAPKRSCFTPPLDLARHIDSAALQRVADQLGQPLPTLLAEVCNDRTRTRWVTLSLLVASHC